MIEVKQIRFGDVVASPLEMVGKGVAITGLALAGLAGLSEDDDMSDSFPLMLTGLGLAGTGVLAAWIGKSMRPKDSKAIKTIITSEYYDPLSLPR